MTNGIPANYLVASKCLGLDGKTYRDMEESQALLEPIWATILAKAKEYYEKALEECGLTSLTLTLQYNETSANNKAASEFLHKSLPEVFGDSFTLELMAGSTSVLNSYIKGWKEGDPNSFELQWRGWNTSTPAPWNGLKVYSSMYSNKNDHITTTNLMPFGKRPTTISKRSWILHTAWTSQDRWKRSFWMKWRPVRSMKLRPTI